MLEGFSNDRRDRAPAIRVLVDRKWAVVHLGLQNSQTSPRLAFTRYRGPSSGVSICLLGLFPIEASTVVWTAFVSSKAVALTSNT